MWLVAAVMGLLSKTVVAGKTGVTISIAIDLMAKGGFGKKVMPVVTSADHQDQHGGVSGMCHRMAGTADCSVAL